MLIGSLLKKNKQTVLMDKKKYTDANWCTKQLQNKEL